MDRPPPGGRLRAVGCRGPAGGRGDTAPSFLDDLDDLDDGLRGDPTGLDTAVRRTPRQPAENPTSRTTPSATLGA
ncbi:hypothetical protein [Streptomyces sp. NPDC059176]|uniref:hypothetical protein n=1 Tax=unclassified Streptomyces TaxID=2593676 RepID=UPI00367FC7EF